MANSPVTPEKTPKQAIKQTEMQRLIKRVGSLEATFENMLEMGDMRCEIATIRANTEAYRENIDAHIASQRELVEAQIATIRANTEAYREKIDAQILAQRERSDAQILAYREKSDADIEAFRHEINGMFSAFQLKAVTAIVSTPALYFGLYKLVTLPGFFS